MKVIIIRDMSKGNESIGETWQETRIFDSQNTLDEVIRWAFDNTSKRKVTISIPDDWKNPIINVERPPIVKYYHRIYRHPENPKLAFFRVTKQLIERNGSGSSKSEETCFNRNIKYELGFFRNIKNNLIDYMIQWDN